MKNKKIYFKLFILILFFNFTLAGTLTFFNARDNKDSRITERDLSASDSGTVEWYQTWGGGLDEFCFGVAVDSVDNIYVTGETGNGDMVLVKYNGSGVQQWNRTWGGIGTESGRGIAIDSLDNIYISGETGSFGDGGGDNLFLVKYNSSGTQQWNSTWGGDGGEYGFGVAVDSLGNIYLSGETESFGEGMSDLFLVKYDSSSVRQWNITWGGIDSDSGRSIAVDSSNNVYVGGTTLSFGTGGVDIVLIKYDSSGVKQWNHTWGGANDEYGTGVAIDSLDNIYVTGATGNGDMVLVKYDNSGTQQWNRIWGGIYYDRGRDVAVDSSDNVYLTGETWSYGAGMVDLFLMKYTNSGTLLWYQTWGGGDLDTGIKLELDSLNNVYIGGQTGSFGAGGYDILLVKFSVEVSGKEQEISGYPLVLFISIICVITVISLKKKYNSSY